PDCNRPSIVVGLVAICDPFIGAPMHALRLGRQVDALCVWIKALRDLGHTPKRSVPGRLNLRPVAEPAAHPTFEPASEEEHSASPSAGRADGPKPNAIGSDDTMLYLSRCHLVTQRSFGSTP